MNKEEIKHLFNTHPSVDEFHVTSDGFAFKVKDHAHDHAGHLKDKEVKIVKRHEDEEGDPKPEHEVGDPEPEETQDEPVKTTKKNSK